MLGGGSITLFHVRGIRIAVDWSWFLDPLPLHLLALAVLRRRAGRIEHRQRAPFALAVASTLGFFGSILLHELGHALAALRNGIGISSIQLWIFGGVARMDRESDSPATEFKVAIAGPLVTLAIVLVLSLRRRRRRGPERVQPRAAAGVELRTDAAVSGVVAMFAWLAAINALRPRLQPAAAFPMDGGRVARAIAWWRTGDRNLGDPLRRQPRPRLRLPLHRRRPGVGRASATSSAASGWR